MTRRTLFWIIAATVVGHVGFFWLFGQMRALPKTRYVPPPNFGYREEVYEDPRSGERTIYREIRVSTRLATPDRTGGQGTLAKGVR